VLRTRVGYTGGKKAKPSYYDLGDHTEGIEIEYDPAVVTYEELLEVFWRSHDPRINVRNTQYRSAIFTHDDAQAKAAAASKAERESAKGATMHTAIEPATEFTTAEDYHQKWYLRKSKDIVRELAELIGDERALMDSPLGTRLNAYYGNHIQADPVREELARLPVEEAAVDALMARIRKSAGD
jgi:peptide-methionine (S)-S-oxide reductase